MKNSLSDPLCTCNEQLFAEISELFPGWLHLNNIFDFGLEYMSPRMERDCGISTSRVRKLGISCLNNLIHPETLERVMPQLIELVESANRNSVLAYYQYIKLPGKDFEWYFSKSKLYKQNYILTITLKLPASIDFDMKIIDELNDNLFLKSNIGKFGKITKREKEVIKFLIRGSSNSIVAKTLNISAYTIKTHRQNIYNKLKINNICELVQFAKTYGVK